MQENDRRRWPTVYAIRHNPTGKIYVGSTQRLETRLRTHIGQLKEGRHPVEQMQRDCDEYGADYSFCILCECLPGNRLVATKFEHLYMQILGTTDPEIGYNYGEVNTKFELEKCRFIEIPDCRLPEIELDPRQPIKPRNSRPKPDSRFYSARRAAGIKGAELARLLGVSRQAVEHWDRGASKPRPEYAKKISVLFGITVDELIKEESNAVPETES